MKIAVINDVIFDHIINHKEVQYYNLTLVTKYGVEAKVIDILTDDQIGRICGSHGTDSHGTEYLITICKVVDDNKFTLLMLEYPEYILKVYNDEKEI